MRINFFLYRAVVSLPASQLRVIHKNLKEAKISSDN